MILSLISLVLAGSLGLTLTPSFQEARVGKKFEITIFASSAGQETLGTDIVLDFDPKIVSLTKFEKGNIYPLYPENLFDIDNVHGKARFTGSFGYNSLPRPVEGIFGKVYFQAKKPEEVKISLVFEPGKTDDSNIVPALGGFDLLTEKPKEAVILIKEGSFIDKLAGFFSRFLPLF